MKCHMQIKVGLNNKYGSIIVFEQVSIPNSLNSNFLITTTDKKAYFVSVGKYSQQQNTQFILESVGISVFYNVNNDILIVGCANGNIYKCNVAKGKVEQKCYVEETQRPFPIICIYLRGSKIFAWNRNSEVTIVGDKSMTMMNRIKFSYDITSTLSIKNSNNEQTLGCISFNNGLPPYIFDCNYGKNLIETQEFITKNYKQYEQDNDYQIYQMCYDRKKDKINQIVCFGFKCGDKKIKNCFIFVYSIQSIEQYKICELQLCIQLNDYPIHATLHNQYLACCYYNQHKVYNLQRRLYCFRVPIEKCVWFFLLKYDEIYEDELRFAIGKGMNIWQKEIIKGGGNNIIVYEFKT